MVTCNINKNKIVIIFIHRERSESLGFLQFHALQAAGAVGFLAISDHGHGIL